jgi:anti-sigma regulatory factor (Ser/Thr protein kinase)
MKEGVLTRHRVSLPAQPASCRAVREIVSRLAQVLPAPVLSDVTIAADELVAQAILVAPRIDPDPITFELATTRRDITLAVEDSSEPDMSTAGTDGESETVGLAVVHRVADRWGIEKRGPMTRTWAVFEVPSPNNVDLAS